MKLLIKYPTRQRPEPFKHALKTYKEFLSGNHEVKFVITADHDDMTMNNQEMQDYMTAQNVEFHYGNSKSKIEAVNANMEGQEFDVLLLASDDMLPKVKGYDNIIMAKMIEHFPNLDGCLHFNDGRKGRKLNTLSIMGKKLYDRFGYIYHPIYKSLYADNEFQDQTEAWGKAVYIDQVIIAHEWTGIFGGQQDDLFKRNDLPWKEDKTNYFKRKSAGFPR